MNKKIIILILGSVVLISGIFLLMYIFSDKSETPQWISSQEMIEKGLIPQPGKILEIAFQYNANSEAELTIGKIQIKNGYAPHYTSLTEGYTLELLDDNGTPIKKIPFAVPTSMADGPPDENQPVQASSFIITTDLMPNATSLQVVGLDGKVIAAEDLKEITPASNQPDFKSIPGNRVKDAKPSSYLNSLNSLAGLMEAWNALTSLFYSSDALAEGENSLDIAFIGDGYFSSAQFEAEASQFAAKLLGYEPFNSRASQIVFHVVNSYNGLGCDPMYNQGGQRWCDQSLVVSKVNGVPYDKIVVIINDSSGAFLATGFYGFSNYDSPCCALIGNAAPSAGDVFAHEFGGHLVGGLVDEYLAQNTAGSTNNSLQQNCYAGTPPATGWTDLVAEGDYHAGCYHPNWYRSAENSIMGNSVEYPFFNAPSQKIINQKIDNFTGSFLDSVQPSVSITSPTDGQEVASGVVTVQTSLSDNLGIARANLYVDSVLYQTRYIQPFNFSWDTTGLDGASHVLEVKAYDVPGNVATTSVTVNVGDFNASGQIEVLVKEGTAEGKRKIDVNAGTYSITEEFLEGWELGSVTCNKPFFEGPGGVMNVTVVSDETTTCIFNNNAAQECTDPNGCDSESGDYVPCSYLRADPGSCEYEEIFD